MQELLPCLLALDDTSLRTYASKGENDISLDFLLWLKDRYALGNSMSKCAQTCKCGCPGYQPAHIPHMLRESQATGRERDALNSLGGKLIALKEGLGKSRCFL